MKWSRPCAIITSYLVFVFDTDRILEHLWKSLMRCKRQELYVLWGGVLFVESVKMLQTRCSFASTKSPYSYSGMWGNCSIMYGIDVSAWLVLQACNVVLSELKFMDSTNAEMLTGPLMPLMRVTRHSRFAPAIVVLEG